MADVNWLEWGDAAFAEAKRLERPVFLFLVASWCRWCKRMEKEVLARPEVRDLLAERFVCVRVDKDRRPEVNERYFLGGWPTTAILSADGERITGGTWFNADDLQRLLERVAHFYGEQPDVITSAVRKSLKREEDLDRARASRSGELSARVVEKVERAILEEFDDIHGGFGAGQKFPHSEAIDFALLRSITTGSPRLREVVEKTLTAIAESPLQDSVEGGFFRYAATRDWRSPHTEKLLETNVGLLRNFLEAYQSFGNAAYRRVAERIVEYLRDHLRHPEVPAFCGSQDSDDEYYSLDRAGRRTRTAPRVDTTVYVNWNAAAVSALFKASAVLDQPSCLRLARETLEFLIEQCYDPGRGMYHYHDGDRHILGLLSDQGFMARALLHATQFTGDRRYLEVAEDLLKILVARQTATHGGFYDIPAEGNAIGSLRRRKQSILENGLIAEVFLRAYHLTMREEYRETAARTLALFAEDYHLYGYFTSGYGRAVDLFLNPPVHAVVVGPREDGATIELMKAANRIYLPSKLVQVLDPEQDKDLLVRFELPAHDSPTAFVTLGRAHVGFARTVDEIEALMLRAGRLAAPPAR